MNEQRHLVSDIEATRSRHPAVRGGEGRKGELRGGGTGKRRGG